MIKVHVCTTLFLLKCTQYFLFIVFLKVLQQVKALQEINCVSVAAGQDHTMVVTDE